MSGPAAVRPAIAAWLSAAPFVPAILFAVAAGAAYASAGVLIHASYHSFGWDLGIFDQVVWSIAHGDGFYYSFRPMPYLGDHFQPALVVLAPTAWLGLGPASLLVIQGGAFGAAAFPLHAAVRRRAGPSEAWALTVTYALSLSVARAIAFDFHPECFVPLLAFTAFWALTAGRDWVFAIAVIALLPLKEDMAFPALALCWLAWVTFGRRLLPAAFAALATAYWFVVVTVVMPGAADGVTNPLLERYAYLGNSPRGIITGAIVRPDLVLEHLAHPEAVAAALLLLAGVAFVPLTRPRLLPPLAFLLVVPLLSVNQYQQELKLHYGVVPYTYAFVVAAVALQAHPMPLLRGSPSADVGRLRMAPAAMALTSAVLFAWLSPLPPSFSAVVDHFRIDRHSAIAGEMIEAVPPDAPVSAQATFVPHLSERRTIYEFPRIDEATFVLLDSRRSVPDYDVPDYRRCADALPQLGFSLKVNEDGIEVWARSPDEAARFGGLDCG